MPENAMALPGANEAGEVSHLSRFASVHLIVAFADTLFRADFKLDTTRDGIIWVQKVADPSQFGVVQLDAEGYITALVEKPSTFVSDLAIIGIYYFRDGDALHAMDTRFVLQPREHALAGGDPVQHLQNGAIHPQVARRAFRAARLEHDGEVRMLRQILSDAG